MAMLAGVYVVSLLLVYLLAKKIADGRVKEFRSLRAAVKAANEEKKGAESDLREVQVK